MGESIESKSFYRSALKFCETIDQFNKDSKRDRFNHLLISLIDLYSDAVRLPDVEKDIEDLEDIEDFEMNVPEIDFDDKNWYWEVFDPYIEEDPINGSLSDDMTDIYKEVKRGIMLYQKNKHLMAVWEWKINFEIHWGSHAIDAMRALHSIVFAEE